MTELTVRLTHIILAAWRRRVLILLPALLLPIAAVFVSNNAPKSYTSHTSMLIQETSKMNPFLQDLAVSSMLNERISGIKTLLKSRHILTMVALEQGLFDEGDPEGYKDEVMAKIGANLTVTQLGKDLLKIQYTSNEPSGMKSLLESVSEHFIEQILAPERSSIRDSSEFLAGHIDTRFEQLQLAEQKLADFTNLNSSLTPEIQSQSYAQIASLKLTLAEKEAELLGVEKSLGSLDDQLSKTNPVVGRIEEQIIDIRSDLTLLQAKYTNSHSAVQAKQRELKRLEQERAVLLSANHPTLSADQLWDVASSQKLSTSTTTQPLLMSQLERLQQVRGRYEALKEETITMNAMIIDLEQRTQQFGDKAKQIFRLQRDVELKREQYEALLQRYEMAQLTGSLGDFEENKRVKVIDRPYTPSTANNLPTVVFIAAGLVGGLGLGIGLAIVFELFDSTIRNRCDVESVTDIPVVSCLPNFNQVAIQLASQNEKPT